MVGPPVSQTPNTISHLHCSVSHTQPKELHRPSAPAKQILGTSLSRCHTTGLDSPAWKTVPCVHSYLRPSWNPSQQVRMLLLCTLPSSSNKPLRRRCCSPVTERRNPRLREITWLARGHTAPKAWNGNLNRLPGLSKPVGGRLGRGTYRWAGKRGGGTGVLVPFKSPAQAVPWSLNSLLPGPPSQTPQLPHPGCW